MSSITSTLSLRSTIDSSGRLTLALIEVPVPTLDEDEVLVRIDAAPLNPSDIGVLFGAADLSTLKTAGTSDRPVVTADVPAKAMPAMAGRVGQALPGGLEGAGLVVATGRSAAAEALAGKRVSALGSAMYSEYRVLKAADCLVLPPGATAADGASTHVNPLTALGFVETMRMEGHTALVNTAAASNLGQMLVRICLKDGVGLVNIVRKAEQVMVLKNIGAVHVCSTDSPTFAAELTDALAATGATIGFDATGGGDLANRILVGMEAAIARKSTGPYSRYGSNVHKQVYLYGSLTSGPTVIDRSVGMAWGVGGWLVMPFVAKAGPEVETRLKKRIVDELTTTFASGYTKQISLRDVLDVDVIAAYAKRATGEKFLVVPSRRS